MFLSSRKHRKSTSELIKTLVVGRELKSTEIIAPWKYDGTLVYRCVKNKFTLHNYYFETADLYVGKNTMEIVLSEFNESYYNLKKSSVTFFKQGMKLHEIKLSL